ncbi:MAG: hypothetical protein HY680_03680 [Chloroflexi bacterium]|nr:hypothetical protein [Chloroflexota bacterium]
MSVTAGDSVFAASPSIDSVPEPFQQMQNQGLQSDEKYHQLLQEKELAVHHQKARSPAFSIREGVSLDTLTARELEALLRAKMKEGMKEVRAYIARTLTPEPSLAELVALRNSLNRRIRRLAKSGKD